MIKSVLEEIILYSDIIIFTTIVITIIQLIGGFFIFKMFKKAGEKPWKGFVPFYWMFSMSKIALGNRFIYPVLSFLLFLLVPFIKNLSDFMLVILNGFIGYMIARAFNKHTAFCILSAFCPIIAMIVINFDNSEYDGPKYFWKNSSEENN